MVCSIIANRTWSSACAQISIVRLYTFYAACVIAFLAVWGIYCTRSTGSKIISYGGVRLYCVGAIWAIVYACVVVL